ncbi:MAG: tetratricopeptide repeat protein [Desulfovibrio sp.]|nr:tetratricopeptide repeat protein [Desulfovibrio sp.]MBI4958437.1 tetratricopeptide repeat protein [Desulfovibrio sp.]
MFARFLFTLVLTAAVLSPFEDGFAKTVSRTAASQQGYAGSQSCKQCHEKFYSLWSTSRHGLAMQPYTAAFAKTQLTPQQDSIRIGQLKYQADLAKGVVSETGPKGTKLYTIEHVLGGKNVYYFLTPFPKGRFQTLPLAYDVNKKAWFDTAASGVRHFPGANGEQAISWQDQAYTFNTSCYSCHVSQLSTNYDPKTDTYRTTWKEAGINCETCHGPSAEHNRVMLAAPKGQPPKDMKIISVKQFTPEQHNATCSGCHAKMSPLTAEYKPGERFFDHYDLVALEDPDFYPDGRDLGENYTYTSWLMSPCAKAGQINCVTCHTSSGRYRFKDPDKANNACLPCHEDRVKNASDHTRHKEGSPASKCISCHMPTTSFARMNRTDHSMLPPTPQATLAYNSPNACTLCHTDKDAAWADKQVREWRPRDYQAPLMERAALIDGARKRDWKQLTAMLEYIARKDRDEVFAASLVRLVPSSGDARVPSTLYKAMKDPSPLVRSAAATALQHVPTPEALQALVAATGDEYRLVRVRAAASLAGYPDVKLSEKEKLSVDSANTEYLASLSTRQDQWSSHYNMGNYHLGRKEFAQAVASYDTALAREPRAVLAMVNQSMAFARLGDAKKAEDSLAKALTTAPDNAAANFNMGLLRAERNDTQGAELFLKKAFAADPQMAQAAYNLGVLMASDRLGEALPYSRKAAELRPDMPKYAYTYAFFLDRSGDLSGAAQVLRQVVERYPGYKDAADLLGKVQMKIPSR